MKIVDEGGESVLEEAQRLTHGDRNVSYGHPLDDYEKTAAFWTTLFAGAGILKEGAAVTAELAALAMVLVKISREVNAPKRDNCVDGAGYFWVHQAIIEERARRGLPPIEVPPLQSIAASLLTKPST